MGTAPRSAASVSLAKRARHARAGRRAPPGRPRPRRGRYQALRDRLAAAGRGLARPGGDAERTAEGGVRLCRPPARRHRPAAHRRPAPPGDLAAVGPYLLLAIEPGRGAGRRRRLPTAAGGRAAGRRRPGLLDDPAFVRDFGELYRYYRQTRVLRARVVEGRLLVVFRTGAGPSDVRVLGWRLGRDGTCEYEGTAREEAAPSRADARRWAAVDRTAYVPGRHPHIALTVPDGGALTLDTAGGALTVRTGGTVHREPVEDALQSLADAEAAYATVGPLILLRVRPYRESAERYFAVNTRTAEVERIDALGQSCLRLPDDQGVVFPGGYALATGGTRTFALGTEAAASWKPGTFGVGAAGAFGERGGRALRLPRPRRRPPPAAVVQPDPQGGRCAAARAGQRALPGRHAGHPARRRRRRTRPRAHRSSAGAPRFVADTFAAAQPVGTARWPGSATPTWSPPSPTPLAGPCRPSPESPPTGRCTRRWRRPRERVAGPAPLARRPRPPADLAGPLAEVRDTGRQVLVEYARVAELTLRARQAVDEAEARITALGRRVRGEAAASAEEWVGRLTELRREQGHLGTLRDTRYTDADRLDALDALLVRELAQAVDRAAAHFADPHAFDGLRKRVARVAAGIPDLATAADTAAAGRRAGRAGRGARHRHRDGRRAGDRRRHRPHPHPGARRPTCSAPSTRPGPGSTPAAATC